jgi:hypothetical protein
VRRSEARYRLDSLTDHLDRAGYFGVALDFVGYQSYFLFPDLLPFGEHVNVAPGGQAIVGLVTAPGGGSKNES